MGGGDVDLSTIPLMTGAQESALEQLLPAVMGMMSGFPLGGAYGGPSESSYGVTSFPEFNGGWLGGGGKLSGEDVGGGEGSGKWIVGDRTGGRDRTGGGGEIREPTTVPGTLSDTGQTTPGGLPGRGTEIQIGHPDLGTGAPQISPGGIQPMTPQMSPGGKGGAPGTAPATQPISPTQQALTQPIIQPFREGMTGNFPRRPMGGR